MPSPAETSAAGSDPDASRSDVAKQEAAQVTGTVKDQSSAVTSAAQEGGQRVVAETKSQVGQLTQEAQAQLKDVLGRSQTEFTGRASEQTDKAAAQLKDLAGELHALAEGRPKDAPRAAGYVRQAADRAEQYASRLDRDGFAGVAEDVGQFARRRPGAFLLGAVAAGFAAGRLARGAQAVSGGDETPPQPTTTRTLAAPIDPVPVNPVPVNPVAPMRPAAPLDPVAQVRPAAPVDPVLAMDPVTAVDPPLPVDPLAEVMPPGYLAGGPGRTEGR